MLRLTFILLATAFATLAVCQDLTIKIDSDASKKFTFTRQDSGKKTTSSIDLGTALHLDGTGILTVIAGTVFPSQPADAKSPTTDATGKGTAGENKTAEEKPPTVSVRITDGTDITSAVFKMAGDKTNARLPESSDAAIEVTFDDGKGHTTTQTLLINVGTADKDGRTVKLDFGVTFSYLRNDKFELRDGQSAGSKQIHSLANDKVNATPIVFVHILAGKQLRKALYGSIFYPLKLINLNEDNTNVGFAIGGQPIGTTGSTNYALGVSFFLGKQENASVILGMQFGQVDRLRQGYVLNSDYQNLKDVPLTKVTIGLPFLGFSYKF